MVASVEYTFWTPLGLAIVEEAKNRNLEILEVKDFNSLVGLGVVAVVNGKNIHNW